MCRSDPCARQTSDGYLLTDSERIGSESLLPRRQCSLALPLTRRSMIAALVDTDSTILATDSKTAPQRAAPAAAQIDGPAVTTTLGVVDPPENDDDAAPPAAAAVPDAAAAAAGEGERPAKKKRAPRKPSAYNIYMGKHLGKWKADNPGRPHTEGFGAVAAMWRTAPENPKNQAGGAAAAAPAVKEEAPEAAAEEESEAESVALEGGTGMGEISAIFAAGGLESGQKRKRKKDKGKKKKKQKKEKEAAAAAPPVPAEAAPAASKKKSKKDKKKKKEKKKKKDKR